MKENVGEINFLPAAYSNITIRIINLGLDWGPPNGQLGKTTKLRPFSSKIFKTSNIFVSILNFSLFFNKLWSLSVLQIKMYRI